MELATRVVFLLLTLSKIGLSEPGVGKADQITVLKCCRSDETLVQEYGEELGRCVPSAEGWNPWIFSTVIGGLIPIPKNWKIQEATRPSCRGGVLTYIHQSETGPFIIFETGDVRLNGGTDREYNPGKYCAETNALLVCQPRSDKPLTPVIQVCCGEGGLFDPITQKCVLETGPSTGSLTIENLSGFQTVGRFPACSEGTGKHSIVGNITAGNITADGAVQFDDFRVPAGQFCIVKFTDKKSIKVIACDEYAPFRTEPAVKNDLRFTLYPVGFLISVVFLAATLVAGWLLPTAHHVLHWRCQTHHVACLMLGDLLMAVIQLGSTSLHDSACKLIAIAAHFFFLAAFFWLNTMCFNIWWTFRDLRPASLEKGQETLRLRVYACYAWGGPLLVAGLAALFDHIPPQPGYIFLRPRFGENQCWFYGDMEILTYFFGPVGVLLAINLLLFAATARELTCGLWKREVVKSTTERAALGRVCMKLVVVMGVTWVADVISWAAGGPQYLWYFTDLINALQGVFIFAVVGCQPQVWTALKRLCNRNPRTNAGRQGNAMSTTSHGMPSMGDSVTQNQSTKTVPLETIC